MCVAAEGSQSESGKSVKRKGHNRTKGGLGDVGSLLEKKKKSVPITKGG